MNSAGTPQGLGTVHQCCRVATALAALLHCKAGLVARGRTHLDCVECVKGHVDVSVVRGHHHGAG